MLKVNSLFPFFEGKVDTSSVYALEMALAPIIQLRRLGPLDRSLRLRKNFPLFCFGGIQDNLEKTIENYSGAKRKERDTEKV